jgi:hypothetical protein
MALSAWNIGQEKCGPGPVFAQQKGAAIFRSAV